MTFTIDPDAQLDYQFDWSTWLSEGEAIINHTVTGTAGITVDSSNQAAGVVTAWLSGATGRLQRVTCHIATNQGREDDRTIVLTVQER